MSRWETDVFRYRTMHVRLQKCLAEVIAAAPGRVLELGCGIGLLRAELRRALPGVDYYACDVAAAAVAEVGDPHVVQADLNAQPLPFLGLAFDCVVGSGIFEYIADLPRLLAALHDRMRPGATLVASYYNMHHVYRRLQRSFRIEPPRDPEWKTDLPSGAFAGLLEAARFRVTRIVPVNVCLTRMRGPKTRQHPLVARIQRRMPLKSLLGHQLIYVAVKAAEAPRHRAPRGDQGSGDDA